MSNTDDWQPDPAAAALPTKRASSLLEAYLKHFPLPKPARRMMGQQWLDEYSSLTLAIAEARSMGSGPLPQLERRRGELERAFHHYFDQ